MDSNWLERLENRRLLSSVHLNSDNDLVIAGNLNTPNTVTIGYSPGERYVVCLLNGVPFDFVRHDVETVYIFCGNAGDNMRVSEARALFDKDVRMMGGAGNDTLIGGTENDDIWAGGGNNFISLGSGDDNVFSQGGNDRILGGDATKVIFGGTGNDVISMGASHGYFLGQGGNDAFQDASGADMEILASAGNDTITAHGDDTIYAGGGDDVIHGGSEVHHSAISGMSKIIEELTLREPTTTKL
jgi:Ca2+-binding RTX toxin-like protein